MPFRCVISRVPCLLLAGLVLAVSPVRAQTVPTPPPGGATVNPGQILNENRRNEEQLRELTDPARQTAPIVSPGVNPAAVPPPGGPKVRLNSIEFDPSVFITKAELDAIAAPYLGKDVDIADIQRIVKAVNDIYAQRSIVTASAYLPPQDLKRGVLRVAIVEGRLGKVAVTGADKLREDFVRSRASTESGQVVDVPLLTRSIASFNKTGVAQVQASLASGASFGLTDINLAVIEPPAMSVNLFADNQGTESVGKHEGGFLIQGYAPLGVDDRFTIYGVGSQGNLYGNIAYSIPFNPWDGRLGVSYGKGHIYVVRGPFVGYDIKGSSESEAINLSQPIFVNSSFYLLANASISNTSSQSLQSDVTTTDNRTIKATSGFSIGYLDENFAVNLSPTASYGQTYFKVTDAKLRFAVFNGTASALVRLPYGFIATASGAFQYSPAQALAGDQLFQIGGPTSVRGFQTGLLSGVSGFFTNGEIHHNADFLLPGIDLFAFYDRGSVYNVSPAVKTLQSVGAGIAYSFEKRFVAEASVGMPVVRVVSNQPPVEVYFRLTLKLTSADLPIFQ